jgi:hypothetical protein
MNAGVSLSNYDKLSAQLQSKAVELVVSDRGDSNGRTYY